MTQNLGYQDLASPERVHCPYCGEATPAQDLPPLWRLPERRVLRTSKISGQDDAHKGRVL